MSVSMESGTNIRSYIPTRGSDVTTMIYVLGVRISKYAEYVAVRNSMAWNCDCNFLKERKEESAWQKKGMPDKIRTSMQAANP